MFVTIPDVCLAVLSRKGQVVGYLPVGRIPFICVRVRKVYLITVWFCLYVTHDRFLGPAGGYIE